MIKSASFTNWIPEVVWMTTFLLGSPLAVVISSKWTLVSPMTKLAVFLKVTPDTVWITTFVVAPLLIAELTLVCATVSKPEAVVINRSRLSKKMIPEAVWITTLVVSPVSAVFRIPVVWVAVFTLANTTVVLPTTKSADVTKVALVLPVKMFKLVVSPLSSATRVPRADWLLVTVLRVAYVIVVAVLPVPITTSAPVTKETPAAAVITILVISAPVSVVLRVPMLEKSLVAELTLSKVTVLSPIVTSSPLTNVTPTAAWITTLVIPSPVSAVLSVPEAVFCLTVTPAFSVIMSAEYIHKLVEVQTHGVAPPAVSSIVATQVASGPLTTLVHSAPPPPAQLPRLCGSQAAWLVGAAVLLHAPFVDAGIQVLDTANVHSFCETITPAFFVISCASIANVHSFCETVTPILSVMISDSIRIVHSFCDTTTPAFSTRACDSMPMVHSFWSAVLRVPTTKRLLVVTRILAPSTKTFPINMSAVLRKVTPTGAVIIKLWIAPSSRVFSIPESLPWVTVTPAAITSTVCVWISTIHSFWVTLTPAFSVIACGAIFIVHSLWSGVLRSVTSFPVTERLLMAVWIVAPSTKGSPSIFKPTVLKKVTPIAAVITRWSVDPSIACFSSPVESPCVTVIPALIASSVCDTKLIVHSFWDTMTPGFSVTACEIEKVHSFCNSVLRVPMAESVFVASLVLIEATSVLPIISLVSFLKVIPGAVCISTSKVGPLSVVLRVPTADTLCMAVIIVACSIAMEGLLSMAVGEMIGFVPSVVFPSINVSPTMTSTPSTKVTPAAVVITNVVVSCVLRSFTSFLSVPVADPWVTVAPGLPSLPFIFCGVISNVHSAPPNNKSALLTKVSPGSVVITTFVVSPSSSVLSVPVTLTPEIIWVTTESALTLGIGCSTMLNVHSFCVTKTPALSLIFCSSIFNNHSFCDTIASAFSVMACDSKSIVHSFWCDIWRTPVFEPWDTVTPAFSVIPCPVKSNSHSLLSSSLRVPVVVLCCASTCFTSTPALSVISCDSIPNVHSFWSDVLSVPVMAPYSPWRTITPALSVMGWGTIVTVHSFWLYLPLIQGSHIVFAYSISSGRSSAMTATFSEYRPGAHRTHSSPFVSPSLFPYLPCAHVWHSESHNDVPDSSSTLAWKPLGHSKHSGLSRSSLNLPFGQFSQSELVACPLLSTGPIILWPGEHPGHKIFPFFPSTAESHG